MKMLLALLFASVLLSSCSSTFYPEKKKATENSELSHNEKLIAWNGVIRQGYMVSIDSNPPGFSHPSEVFASANSELKERIQGLTGDPHADCFLVPRFYGYDIEIISKRFLTKEEKDRMNEYVEKALLKAQEKIQDIESNQTDKSKMEAFGTNQNPQARLGLSSRDGQRLS